MKYRAEIDGLRALAVIPVILFHAGFELFGGGFVGVDVFFVISGYLITTILIEDIEKKRFNVVNFYERRARRILPALFFVMLTCIPFAWIWMSPNQMKDFSQSLVAVTLFTSNILFWQESGYFDAASDEKPLLHTWSLAVEEQYYVLFPIFLILAWRFGKNRVFWMIVVIAAISLMISEWGWRNKATPNFYLAPTRAWELLAGSIAAFIVQKNGIRKNNLLALLGLGVIFFSFFVYDASTPFPSVYALAPVLGVVLIVLYADEGTLVARLLSTRAFVGIGLISYSTYLWHQPLFAFIRIGTFRSAENVDYIFASLLAIFFGYLSFKYIESPLRNRELVNRNYVFLFSVLGGIFFIVIGSLGDKTNGFDFRLEAWQRQILEWEKYPRNEIYRVGTCFLYPEQTFEDFKPTCTAGDADTLIWGDSHAAAMSSGWRHIENIHQLTASDCPPILNASIARLPHCAQINRHVEIVISSGNYKNVILHANWQALSIAQLQNLADTLTAVKEFGVENIWVIGGVPQYEPSLPARLLSTRAPLDEIKYINASQKQIFLRDELIRSATESANAEFISSLDLFCENEKCKVTVKFQDAITPVVWDYGHLTEGGAVYFATRIAKIISND